MSNSFRVLVTDRFALEAIALLEKDGRFELIHSVNGLPSVDVLQTIDAFVIRSKTRIDKDLLRNSPRLRVIATATSGFDHINLDETRLRGVEVFFSPEGNERSAAELAWALTLACARKIPAAHGSVQKGAWEREPVTGLELSEKTYGIIGLGRIGYRVAKMAIAFGMKVVAYDPYADDERFESCQAQRIGFEELLRMADIVSLHIPLTKETYHMINRQALELMTDDAFLVNTSRGPVIDEQDLIRALRESEIRGAGLDVFEREPLDLSSPLLKLTNVVLSPHVGANTHEAFQRVSIAAAKSLIDFVNGTRPKGNLPPQEIWYTQPKGFN